MNKNFFNKIATASGLLIGAFALSAIAQTWQGPPGPPPECPAGSQGCDTALNSGSKAQTKTGLLSLKNLLYNADGSDVPVGSVLTAIDKAGTVGWTSAGGGGSGWITVAPGGVQSNRILKYPIASNKNPENMCIAAGYKHAAGACMGNTGSPTNFDYIGSIESNNSDDANWNLTCAYGDGTSFANSNTKILCTN